MKNKNQERKEKDIQMSFVTAINKRDEIYELINSSREYFKNFLAKKVDPQWDVTSKKVENNYKIFLENSKLILVNINSFKNKVLEKKEKFIKYINMYSLFLTEDMDKTLTQCFKKINDNFNLSLKSLQKEFEQITLENQKILERKQNFEKITKSKIENIKNSMDNQKRFDSNLNNEKIKMLLNEYDKFIKEEIEIDLDKNGKELVRISIEMKQQENINIEDTYKISAELKKDLKTKLKKIANIEKNVIVKIIDFQDTLEDISNFNNDQNAKYKILFKKKRIVKLNTSKEILKDINLLFSQMANTEKLFDNINFSANNIKNKIEVNKNNKLLAIQSNISGESESTKTVLLENNKIDGSEV